MALNSHGLYYANSQKIERESILDKSNLLDTIGHNNYYKDTIEQLDKDREKLVIKRDNSNSKVDSLDNDLKSLQKEKKELQEIADSVV